MLNLFKKREQIQDVPTETVVATEVKSEIIIDSKHIKKDIQESFEQILNQFDIDLSQESQIDELRDKIQSYRQANAEIYRKIEDLKSLGLVNTPSVRVQLERLESNEKTYNFRIKEIENKIENAKYNKDLVSKYSLKYPHYKFVSRGLMISIMKKYSLVLADACFYGKEIPQENLEIIKSFQKEIKETEKTFDFIESTYFSGFGSSRTYGFEEKVELEKVFGLYPDILHDSRHSINKLASFTISSFKMVAPESHFEIPSLKLKKENRREDTMIVEIPAIVMNPETRMFEFNKKQVEEVNKVNREVLDPIACLEVEGGFVIMSAWDKEAEIPGIQNENWN